MIKRSKSDMYSIILNLKANKPKNNSLMSHIQYTHKVLINIAYYKYCSGSKQVQDLLDDTNIYRKDTNFDTQTLYFNRVIDASIIYFKSKELYDTQENNALTIAQFFSALNRKIRALNTKLNYKDNNIYINDSNVGYMEDSDRVVLYNLYNSLGVSELTIEELKNINFDISMAIFKAITWGYNTEGYTNYLDAYGKGNLIKH